MGFWCFACSSAIPLASVTGRISYPLPGVADVCAAAACRCGNGNTYRFRLKQDATCSYVENGKWVDGALFVHEPGVRRRAKRTLEKLKIRWHCYRLARKLRLLQKLIRTARVDG